MTPDEYAASFLFDLQVDEIDDQILRPTGISASMLGHCREYARRIVVGEPFTDAPDLSPARAGKFYHRGIAAARAKNNPNLLVEGHNLDRLTITFPSGAQITGQPDEIDPDEPSVSDFKTKNGLDVVRKHGPSMSDRYQRHALYLGAVQAGLVPEQGIVRNVYIDRSGAERDVVIEQEPFSMDVISEIDGWISDVIYAVKENEESSRDRDYTWCSTYCSFFTGCRHSDEAPSLDSLITDENLIRAARTYRDGHLLETEGARMKKAAKAELGEAQGVAGDLKIRRVWVNGSQVSFERKPYWRLTVGEAS